MQILGQTKKFNTVTSTMHNYQTEQAEAMTSILTTAFQQFVPLKTFIVRVSDQPWVNSYKRLHLQKKN